MKRQSQKSPCGFSASNNSGSASLIHLILDLLQFVRPENFRSWMFSGISVRHRFFTISKSLKFLIFFSSLILQILEAILLANFSHHSP